MLPDTDATHAHNFALNMMEKAQWQLAEEGSVSVLPVIKKARHLEQYLNNAEVAPNGRNRITIKISVRPLHRHQS